VKPGATFGLPDRSREVAAKVEGLVWFNVKKNSRLPMTVNTDDGVLTRVLGTCFAVDARPGRKTKVTLASGKVRVVKGPESVQLRPNQQVVFNNGRLQVSPVHDKTGLLAWSGEPHLFRFDSTNLEQAVTQIADYYGMTVDNPDHITGIPITGSYQATKNPEDVLQLIQKAESGAAYLRIVAGKIVISRF
jgi:transmembrane sensor